MIPIEKVVCGGQSGGDIAGAMFAVKHSIPVDINICRNFVPVGRKGFPNEIVSRISNVDVVTQKTGIPGLIERTEYNVIHSDFTVLVLDRPTTLTKGTALTIKYCNIHKKTYFELYVEGKEHFVLGYKDVHLGESEAPCPIIIFNVWYLLNKLDNYFNLVKNGNTYGFIVNIAGPRDLDEELGVRALEKLFFGDE